MESNEIEPAIDADRVIRIAEHYCHARRKHPHFADRLFFESSVEWKRWLDNRRRVLAMEVQRGFVNADTVLWTDVTEAAFAFDSGDKAHAVEECYNAIAVLLRMIDVLEGKQKLGKAGG